MEKEIVHIGELKGTVLVFGGVCSNLQALEKLAQLAEANGIKASNVICTGDIVAYCAQPEECVQLIKRWGIHSIAGNVELQINEGQEDCACDFVNGGRCDTFSKQWYPFAKSQLSKSSLSWMKELPKFLKFSYCGKKVFVLHGSFHYSSEYIFRSTDWSVKQKNFEDSNSNVILAGHSGLPFSQQKEEYHWLNSGVVGMPANDGTPRVWSLLLDDKEGKFSYQHVPYEYDNLSANRLMHENKLPAAYAKTLLSGVWDNCEILPKAETAAQGVKIIV